ncbi:MAG: hypothetical protein JSV20_03920 [Candidatus Bathyarchaeota archaeon]|nr:MAG: hypothetical protein JSV20_03920 [Candidatus Bathyarchaeota archaeon]
MPIFLLNSRHSPKNCPRFNEKARKTHLDIVANSEELLNKYGVKVVGGWVVPSEHLWFVVYEAPSFEAFQKLGTLVAQLAAYDTTEVKLAVNLLERIQMLKQIE